VDSGSSGISETPGNDFMVTLDDRFQQDARNTAIKYGTTFDEEWIDMQAATFMHELGHNFNLDHGGLIQDEHDETNCKPNYLSIMSYSLQFRNWDHSRPLDYSGMVLETLNEDHLNEFNGIGVLLVDRLFMVQW